MKIDPWKRNNIVIWNVAENAEKQFSSCEALVKSILSGFMGLEEDVKSSYCSSKSSRRAILARPIDVALLISNISNVMLRQSLKIALSKKLIYLYQMMSPGK